MAAALSRGGPAMTSGVATIFLLLCVALAVAAGPAARGRSTQLQRQQHCVGDAERSRGANAPAAAGTKVMPAGGGTRTGLEPRASAPRPHMVMAVFDDLGFNDLGSFSGGALTPRTPFMDELMAGGIKLKQFYVQPICSPTRSALM